MKNNFKKSIVALCALGCVGAFAFGASNLSTASATAEETTNYFAMEIGAQVRTVPDSMGIRFTTNVGEAYQTALTDDGYTVSYGTLVSKSESVASITVENETSYLANIPCSKAVTFDENGNFTYTSAVVFDRADFEESEWIKASATELTARAYVKLEKDGATTYQYAEATDTTRSMRAVANAEILTGDSEGLDEYVGSAIRKTDFEAYEIAEAVDGKVVMTVAAIADGGYTAAYIDAKRVGTVEGSAVTFDADVVASMGLTLGEKYPLSFFDENNNVYSMQVMYVTDKLTKGTDMAIFDVSADQTENLTGYYIMGNSFTVSKGNIAYHADRYDSKATAVDSVGFAGTFDGMGYTCTYSLLGELGMFAFLGDGAVVKNVSIVVNGNNNVQSRKYTGHNVLAYTTSGTVKLENVHVNVAVNNGGYATHASLPYNRSLINKRDSGLIMTNVIVESPAWVNTASGGVFFFQDSARAATNATANLNKFKNVYAIAGVTDNESTTDVDETVVAAISKWSAAATTANFMNANNDGAGTAANGYYYANINRYVTLADLFATFTEENPNTLPWNLSNGALVWKN